MKLIIDIDEERLETIRKYPLIYNSDEYKAIANGTPYNPSGDLISREAIRKALNGAFDCEDATKYDNKNAEQQSKSYSTLMLYEIANIVKDCCDNAPSIEGNQNDITPKGEWINHRNDYGHNIADCSVCGHAMQWHDEDEDGVPRYCWFCGAKIDSVED